ncbi:MAG: Crp/Fnr family transcriptional regulator [Burkholderiaceae bacterium]
MQLALSHPAPPPLAPPPFEAQHPAESSPLARFALFASVPAPLLAQLAADITCQHHRGGEHLWYAGDQARHITLIERGIVEIERTRRSGDGVVLGLFGTGQSVGLPAALAGSAYPADAVALGDRVDVVRVRATALVQLMQRHLSFTLAVNRALLQHNAALRSSIEILGAGAVPKRLAVLFLFLGHRFGSTDAGGCLHIHLALTREQIGRLVGARVETVIRIISRWQKAGWIKGARSGIEIARVDMLQRMADAG